jgi:membrane-bound metal-dependent hydrolase YbcI (DUF457 family)
MAGFKTHITVSSLIGVGYGGVAHFMYGVPWPTCALAGGLCGVSGMLPDVDSDSSTPHWGMSNEMILLAGAGVYLLIRFGAAALLQLYTVHRGMFHSIPAALVFGEFAFLLAAGDDLSIRIFVGAAVTLGYLTHLLLDEIYSIEWNHGLRLKSSFGTALKLFGHGAWGNLTTYAKLAILSAAILFEPQWPVPPTQPGASPAARQTATRLIDQILRR